MNSCKTRNKAMAEKKPTQPKREPEAWAFCGANELIGTLWNFKNMSNPPIFSQTGFSYLQHKDLCFFIIAAEMCFYHK